MIDPSSIPAPLAERFEFLAPLGRGAMGAVYRVRERHTGRELALKVLHSLSARAHERLFAREGALTASLDHPGIVRVHSAGELGGLAFLAYELIEGATPLSAQVGRERFLERWLQAARAVAHAHEQGVVHRDLKPDNVLVDAEGRAHVADFGLAWARGVEDLTQTGTVVGTPAYMSPEAVTGTKAHAPQADVWSLGVILYEGLTDTLPFAGGSAAELVVRITRASPQPPRELDPSISPALERVCLRALAGAVTERYADAGALVRACEEALARPGGPRARGLALAVVVALALGGALGGAAYAHSSAPPAPTPATSATLAAAPTPEATLAWARARELVRARKRLEALDLLDATPGAPPELIWEALLPLVTHELEGNDPPAAQALLERACARRALGTEVEARDRGALAGRCVRQAIELGELGVRVLSSERGMLTGARRQRALLRVALLVRPPGWRCSTEAIEAVIEGAGVWAHTQAQDSQIGLDVLFSVSELLPDDLPSLQSVAAQLGSTLPRDQRARLTPLRRRIYELSRGREKNAARYHLARNLFRINESDAEALALALVAIRTQLTYRQRSYLLDRLIEVRLRAGSWEAALARADERLPLEPGDPGTLVWRARALQGLGRLDEARRSLREALTNFARGLPSEARLQQLCDLLWSLGTPEEQRTYRSVLALSGRGLDGLRVAWVDARAGDLVGALAHVKRMRGAVLAERKRRALDALLELRAGADADAIEAAFTRAAAVFASKKQRP